MGQATDQATRDLADKLLDTIKTNLGPDAWSGLSGDKRDLIAGCTYDAASLQIRALAGPQTPAAQQALLLERRQITAQLENIGATGASKVAEVLDQAIKLAVQGGIAIAFAAI
jgi:hypothetical protein